MIHPFYLLYHQLLLFLILSLLTFSESFDELVPTTDFQAVFIVYIFIEILDSFFRICWMKYLVNRPIFHKFYMQSAIVKSCGTNICPYSIQEAVILSTYLTRQMSNIYLIISILLMISSTR